MCTVTHDGGSFTAYRGELLSEALIRAGLRVTRPCGGRGMCGKCRVTVDGEEVLSCKYRVEKDITVVLPEEKEIVSETRIRTDDGHAGGSLLALDIGTTTLALALVSEEEKRAVRVVTRVNPQTVYGADVMMRIGVCRKDGPQALHRMLIDEINGMIASVGVSDASRLAVSGNTTMLHLFLGIDCSGLGSAPYTPAYTGKKECDAAHLGIRGVEKVITLPNAAAFVGADIVAGLGMLPEPCGGRYGLLVDLGTNAELALFSDDSVLCAAAAAGPCFEGANISCGMSASEGAIYRAVGDDPLICETIGGKRAVGVCGTGLIGVMAALLENGTVDETGYMADGRVRLAEDVFLTQADVRQYQLAKSAVCSGIETLLSMRHITADEVDTVYLSGGFSASVDPVCAARTGLIPRALAGRCKSIGNSSLLGTVAYLLGTSTADAVIKRMTYVDLAASAEFTRRFTDNMLFECRKIT